MSSTKPLRPARATLSIPLLLLPLVLSAVEYKWTGAVSSDFTDAANWLVESGGAWVQTATPPTNEYGVDTVVFEGDAATCPNMPVLDIEYFLRKIEFRTSGWTISGTGRICLNHRYGGNDYRVDGVQHGNINGPSLVDSSGSGTNEIATDFRVAYGYEIDVAEGGTLAITGLTTCDNGPGNNLGSAQKHSLKTGDGTLLLGGVGSTGKFTEKYMEVTAGTLQLGRTSDGTTGVAALAGTLHVRGTGKVVYLADNQVTDNKDWWMLGGNGTIDFNGHAQTLAQIACGVAANTATVGGDWTGAVLNSEKVRVGTANSGSSSYGHFLVNTAISQPVVLESGIDTNCGRYNGTGGNALWYYIGDNPNLDAELIIGGTVFPGRTGNNGVPIHFTASTPSDGSYGAVLLECVNGSGGQYARAFIETTVYVNDNGAETSSLGQPRELTVTETGVLRGNGVVAIDTGKSAVPKFDIYGTLAPGSTNNVGTLRFTRSATNVGLTTTMHTNSVFRVVADETGTLPSVNQDTGTFVLEAATAATTDPDTGDEIPAAPGVTLRITGATPPAEGVTHRILTAPTLTGKFDEVEVDFPGAKGYHYEVIYGANYVDFRCSRIGTVVLFR